jgi:hypothetical protein
MYCLRRNRYTTVTARVHKWHHYIDRVKLTFVEDLHYSYEETEEAIRRGRPEPKALFPEDYPKHFEIVCRPRDLLYFAKVLTEICESVE